ncbi:MAG TPA: nicotinamide riboside transporter PnuC, partial [Saprospiraceae bacterium]|nr:nicotinamide riboside transporter PnuC [Saprospiraceae bacterium]
AKYYGDMALQIVYVIMQAQGWYEWSRGDRDDDNRISVRKLSRPQWALTGAGLLGLTGAIGYLLHRFTDAALPWVDAFTTALSLLAQWWMNKKYLDNWTLWIIADVIYLYQYAYKALYFTTALYAVFLVLAVVGLREWQERYRAA